MAPSEPPRAGRSDERGVRAASAGPAEKENEEGRRTSDEVSIETFEMLRKEGLEQIKSRPRECITCEEIGDVENDLVLAALFLGFGFGNSVGQGAVFLRWA
jgi:hypothetical protein